METFDSSFVGETDGTPPLPIPNSSGGALRCPMTKGCYLDDLASACKDIEGASDVTNRELVRRADLMLAGNPPCGCVARMRDLFAR